MKRLSIAILSLLFVFSLFISCNNETPVPTLGSINGRVIYSSSNNNINVSLEKSNGVSIESRFFRSTKANNDGSYSFSDLEAGTYTVYASTDDSVQKAVCTNVNVEAGRGVTASDLVLTPIGSIKGKILIDGKKSGNIGCTVFIEGTSYKAVTADDGSFEITGIPSGKEYKLFVMKGETISFVASSVKVPDASAANIDSITIDSSMLSHGIIWKGSLPNHPDNPVLYWAYYNSSDGNSYIFNGTSWDILAKAGAAGEKGDTGTSITWLGSYAGHPSSTTLYAAYYNTTDGNSYIYDGSSWTILASKGGQGDKGETGEQGETGATGPSGLDGKSIIWKGSLATAPTAAEELWAYYNTGDGNSYIYNGTSWDILAKAGATGPQGDKGEAGTSITWFGSFSCHPTLTTLYAAYYNTTDGNSYIYDGFSWTILASKGGQGDQGASGLDGRSMVWKGSLASAPSNAEELWAYYNTTDGNAYIYSGSSWNLLIENVSINYDEPTIIGTVAQSEYYDLSSVYIKVVDNTNDSTVWNDKPAADGDFAISGLDSSRRYTLYFSSEKLSNVNISYGSRALAPDNTSTTYGAVMIDVRPLPGKAQDIGEVTLTPNGTVMGTVTLKGEDDSSDIDVYLYGTSFATKTSADGSYIISDIPQGTYRVVFMKDGFVTEEKNVILFNSNASVKPVVTIPSFSLLNYCGSISGKVSVNDSGNGSGVEVKAVNKDGEHTYTVITDNEGYYSIPSAYYGEYTISFSKNGYKTFIKSNLFVEKNKESVVSPQLQSEYGSLKIFIGYPDKLDSSGIVVSIYREGTLIHSVTSTDTGEVIVPNLCVGNGYSICAQAEGYEPIYEKDIYVFSGKETQVNLPKLYNKFGSISGVIRDSFGNPIEGATVFLESDDGYSYTIVSSTDGSFFKNNICANEYRVTISKPQFSSVVLSPKYVVEVSDITVIPDVTLTSIFGVINGEASFMDGKTPKNITICIEDNAGVAVNTSTTSNTGKFSFAVLPGTYVIRANSTGYDEVRYVLTVQAGGIYSAILDPLSTIYGSLKVNVGCNNNVDLSGITVTVEKNGQFIRNSVLSSSGYVIFSDMPTGDGFSVYATASGYSSSSLSNITINRDNLTEITLEDLSYNYGSISGKIEDVDGIGLQGALILLSSITNSYTITTEVDGSFKRNDIASGIYSVSVSLQDYTSTKIGEEITVSSANETKLGTTKLSKIYGSIKGKVSYRGQSDSSGIIVSLINQNGNVLGASKTTVSGEFNFDRIAEGTYTLSATATNYSISSCTVIIKSGTNLTVNLDPLVEEYGLLAGTVLDEFDAPIVGAVVLVTSQDGFSETLASDSNGLFSIKVKKGIYSLTVSKSGYKPQTIIDVVVDAASIKTINPINLNTVFASIIGSVQLEFNSNYAGALVTATNIKESGVIYSAITNSQGDFSISGVLPGEYSIVITADDYVTTILPTIIVSDTNKFNVGIVMLPIARGRISGIAKLEGYSDYSGIVVSLVGTEYSTTTTSDGSYSFNVPIGNYSEGIKFEFEDFETTIVNSTITVLANSTYSVVEKTLKCVCIPYVSGKVKVLGLANENYENITIKIAELPSFTYVTNTDGTWFFEHVPIGSYTLEFERENITNSTRSIELKPAPTVVVEDVELMPDSFTIMGDISLDSVSDYSGVYVRITTPNSDDLTVLTDLFGHFSISNVIASKSHVITFEKEGWDSQSFVLEGGKYEPLSIVNYTDVQPVILNDTIAPILTNITVTVGRSTEKGREISLCIDGFDKGSGIKYIKCNTTGIFEDTTKQEFCSPITITIPDELGMKTIYVQVEDATGNVSNQLSTEVEISNDLFELYGTLSEEKLHLTKVNSPYLMTNNVIVEKGSVLMVDPGVEIRINGDYCIQIEGTLSALGTDTERIKIIGIEDGANNWEGIKFLNNNLSAISFTDIMGLKNGIVGYCDISNSIVYSNEWALGMTDQSNSPDMVFSGEINNSIIQGNVAIVGGNVINNTISGDTRIFQSGLIFGNKITANSISIICGVIKNNIIEGDVIIGDANVEGNTISGDNLETSFSLVYNCDIYSLSASTFGDVYKKSTYNGCSVNLGNTHTNYSSSKYVSRMMDMVFNNCSFTGFAVEINNSNFIECGQIEVTSNYSDFNSFDCTGNYWGEINTAEIKEKGEKENLSFIKDYFDDISKTLINISGYKAEEILDIGYEDKTEEETIAEYKIGDIGPAGGWVFYDKGYYSDGWRYLEVAPTDIGSYVFGFYKPYNDNTHKTTGELKVVGSGKYNTERLVKYMDINGLAYIYYTDTLKAEYAARKCLDYSYGGYDDWFLPSQEEMWNLYLNLYDKGNYNFSSYYWTSTEGNEDYGKLFSFNDGGWGYELRQSKRAVRAIRAF
ncbi:MAG: carboxypeptidase regulatory-like domain-containing protein [Candidatus Ornithospirochaeta sp.]